MARLQLLYDNLPVRSYALHEPGITIGRGGDNDISLNDPVVSVNHAIVRVKADNYLEGHLVALLEDLDSTNGTLVNGHAVRRHILQPGDRIRIGCQELVYETDDPGTLDRTAIYLPDEPR